MNLQTAMATLEANPMSTTFFEPGGHVLGTRDLSQKMPGMAEDGSYVLTAPKLLVLRLLDRLLLVVCRQRLAKNCSTCFHIADSSCQS